MKTRVRVLIAVAALAVIAGMAAGVWMLVAEPLKQRRRLPDGSVVTLEAVTYGKNHSFDPKRWWEHALPSVSRMRSRTGGPVGVTARQTPRDALIAWVRH